MSIQCSMTTCNSNSHVICYTCNESLCRDHFSKHDHSFNSLLNQFNDKIRELDDRLYYINNEEHIENCYEKLDQWRNDCYQLIDSFYDKKYRELKTYFNENMDREQEKITDLQTKVNDLLKEENVSKSQINLIKTNIDNIENEINKLEKTNFDIFVTPIIIDKNLIKIEKFDFNNYNLMQITQSCQTINCTNNLPKPLSSNEQYLVVYQMKKLCFVNKDLKLIKQIPWNYGRIWNICWFSALNRFIIIGHYEIYTIDDKDMLIEPIQTISRENWWSCTCSNTKLYLSTYKYGSSIYEYELQSSTEIVKHIKSSKICTKNESIKDLVYNNGNILFTVHNKKYSKKYIQLRSEDQFDLIWSNELDIQGLCNTALRACSLNNDQWIITDYNNQRLFHINNDGTIKTIYTYNASPWYVNVFNSNVLVISTEKSIHFHKL